MAFEKLNKIMYRKVPGIVLGRWQMWATVAWILALAIGLSFLLWNIFLLCGFLSLVLFMTAHCLCQGHCLWFAEFCFLKMKRAFHHFQSTRNLPFYICFSKIADRSLLIPLENSLWSSNELAKRLENTGGGGGGRCLHNVLMNLGLSFSHSGLILFFLVQIPCSWTSEKQMQHKGSRFPVFIHIPQLVPSLSLPWTFPGSQSNWESLMESLSILYLQLTLVRFSCFCSSALIMFLLPIF